MIEAMKRFKVSELLLLSLVLLPSCAHLRESPPEARRVIVLCDMSGSMLEHRLEMDAAVEQIVNTLGPGDVFNFGAAADRNTAPLYETPNRVLSGSRQTFDTFWNNVHPHGGDAMIEGAGWLIGQRPDVAWIITDGDIEDIDAVCRVLSSARRVAPFELKITPIGTDPKLRKNLNALQEAAGRPTGAATRDPTTQQAASPHAADSATYFSIALPAGWTLAEVESVHSLDDRCRGFAVRERNGLQVFKITVAVDGPRFINCWCRPWSEYQEYEQDGIKYANLYLFDGRTRTLKAMGQRYGTDVHLNYEGHDKDVLNKVAESIRPR